MEISNSARDALTPLSRDQFERLKVKEFVPIENLTGLKLLREKAGNERSLRELYRDRAPFELIQNADDAGATSAAFVLSADGVSFGHNGRWFTIENFRSLAEGWSSKNPRECIGHKGLGFRSVLDVTPSPVVGRLSKIASEQFAVRFSWNNNNSFVQRTIARSPSWREQFESWTKHGQSACPVMAIPSAVRIDSLGGGVSGWNLLSSWEYTTFFWLPSVDAELPRSAAEQLSVRAITSAAGSERLLTFMNQDLDVIMPFLRNLRSVSVFDGKQQLLTTTLKSEESRDNGPYWIRNSTLICSGKVSRRRNIFQTGTRCTIPAKIKNDPHTPLAARFLADVGVTLAVELVDERPVALPHAPFHVYFPTEDTTGSGFIVHADFHVEPNRKHLMVGAFNGWLLKEAAKLAAGPFLTELVAKFPAAAVFDALGPTSESTNTPFLNAFAEELQCRRAPFIPSVHGLLPREEVILAPSASQAHFYETQLVESLGQLQPNAFLISAEADCTRTRAFLKLAKIGILNADSLIELIEHAAKLAPREVEWWLRSYTQMSTDPIISSYSRSRFFGKYLVPGEKEILAVPADGAAHLCLPPQRLRSTIVPTVFTPIFRFVDSRLADQLDDPADTLGAWVRDRFGISRFEASELLPRAISAVNGKFFSGELGLSRSELAEMWTFVRALTSTSRMQKADDVWSSIGRLPLPSEDAPMHQEALESTFLVPAFLLYWPNSHAAGETWMQDLPLPRVSSEFLAEISGGQWSAEWAAFFTNAGVSKSPKLLEYVRMPGYPETVLAGELTCPNDAFTGDRQRDENAATLTVLWRSGLWRSVVASTETCGHSGIPVIHSIHVLDGILECSTVACEEYSHGAEKWKSRLQSLSQHLAPQASRGQFHDSGYCRSQGGHLLALRSVVELQAEKSLWLPSSKGPSGCAQCFLRQPMHRIISGTAEAGELNDAILSFVVADDLSLFADLSRAGVRVFESVSGADEGVLSDALNQIGSALSSSWGQENVLKVPSRWRAVRGALQDIFRSLNQLENKKATQIRLLPVRTPSGVHFAAPPIWYAEPGPLRDAFAEKLPLLDADRSYPEFLRYASVTPLVVDETVIEKINFDQPPVHMKGLRHTLVQSIGPFMLAMLAARIDSRNELELAERRLHERFQVAATSSIHLAFVLVSDPEIRVEYTAGRYYLQRRLVGGRGAIEVAHFTLYIAHAGRPPFSDLDADAVGAYLSLVLQDRPSAEMTALCARIATRFKEVSGDVKAMKDFMYNHLQVSAETQEAIESKETAEVTAGKSLPPPPIVISSGSTTSDSAAKELIALITEHQNQVSTQATHVVSSLVAKKSAGGNGSPIVGGGSEDNKGTWSPNSGQITSEQEERGLRGEEEMKRRLTLPGGWSGFSLEQDVRSNGCGFDFLAKRGGGNVRIEIKTFTTNGRILFTGRELREAAVDGDTYYMIGFLDDGGPAGSWKTLLLQNPLLVLLREGIFALEERLVVEAKALFVHSM